MLHRLRVDDILIYRQHAQHRFYHHFGIVMDAVYGCFASLCWVYFPTKRLSGWSISFFYLDHATLFELHQNQ